MRILRSCVVIVKKDDKFLLGLNKRGFNRDKWSGFGGVVQPKEDLKTCAERTVKNQCGLVVDGLEKVGKIEVKFAGVQEVVQYHVYVCETFTGEPKETLDMKCEWFAKKTAPLKNMWTDVSFWLPPVLDGKRVKGFFIYENDCLIYSDLNAGSNEIRPNNGARFQRLGQMKYSREAISR